MHSRLPKTALCELSLVGGLLLAIAGCGGGSSSTPPPESNPVPTLSSISPSSVSVASPDTAVTLSGSGFMSTSSVSIDGQAQAVSYVSGNQLKIMVPASNLSTAGTHNVSVTNPSPGGGTSSSVTFTVTNLPPTLESVDPSAILVGGGATRITLNGEDFLPNSSAQMGTTALDTTFVSSEQLVATLPASSLAATGSLQVAVSNPPPGGGNSNLFAITVTDQFESSVDPDPKGEEVAADPESPTYFIGIPGTPPAVSTLQSVDLTKTEIAPNESATSAQSSILPAGTRCSFDGPAPNGPPAPNSAVCVPHVPWMFQLPPGDPTTEWASSGNCATASYLMVKAYYDANYDPNNASGCKSATCFDFDTIPSGCPASQQFIEDVLQSIDPAKQADCRKYLTAKQYYPAITLTRCQDGEKSCECKNPITQVIANDQHSCIYYPSSATGGLAYFGPEGGFALSTIWKIAGNDGFVSDSVGAQVATGIQTDRLGTLTTLQNELANGHPIIVHVNYKMRAPGAGHYMVLVGLDTDASGNPDLNGYAYTNDPAPLLGTSDLAAIQNKTGKYISYSISAFLSAWDTHGDEYLVLRPNHAPVSVSWLSNSLNFPPAQLGALYSASVSVVGLKPFDFSVVKGSLPAGLKLDANNGSLSGTALQTGTFPFTLQVVDSAVSFADAPASITVGSAPVSLTITSPATLAPGKVNVAYPSLQLTAAGGISPYGWSSSNVPPGLSVSSAGILSGTPTTEENNVSFAVQVTDSSTPVPQTFQKNLSLTIIASNLPPIVNSLTATSTTVNPGGQTQLTCIASDPENDPLTYTWSKTNGSINGNGSSSTWTAPTSPGLYTVTCTVSEAGGNPPDSRSIRLTVNGGSLTAAVSPRTGVSNSTSFAVSGSGATPNGSVTGTITLPDSTTTSSKTIANASGQFNFSSFTESVAGTYTEVISDDKSGIKSHVITWTVSPANLPGPTLLAPADGTQGVSSTPTFSWNAVTGNVGYRIMVATSQSVLPTDPATGTCSACFVNDTTAGTSYTPSVSLSAGTTYYWQVHALTPTSLQAYGTWSAPFSFTTISTLPDLVVQNVRLSSYAVAPGSNLNVSFGVVNQGNAAAVATTTRLRLSVSSAGPSTSDPILSEVSTIGLAAGASAQQSAPVTIPAGTAPGSYYVWAIVDAYNVLTQSNTTNDHTASPSLLVTASQTGTAIVLGQPLSGTLSTSVASGHCNYGAPADRYTLNLSSAASPTLVTIAASSTAFDSFVCILDQTNNLVAQDDDSAGALNAGTTVSLNPGQYFVEVSSFGGSGAGPYVLSAVSPTVIPAAAISLGDRIVGNLSSSAPKATCYNPSPSDRWTFTLTGSTTVTIDAMSTAFDTYVCLLDANSNYLGSDNNSGAGTNARLISRNLPVGTYYIEVSSQSAGYTGGTYTLSLQTGLPPGKPIGLGMTVSGGLGVTATKATCYNPSPGDRWTFALTSSTTVTIDALSTAFDAYVCLLDANNNYYGSDNNSGAGTNARLISRNLPVGTYYIEVSSQSAGYTGGAYTLSLQAGFPPGTPISLGQTVAGTLSSANAKATCYNPSPGDRWAFTLTSSTTVTIDAMSTAFDTYVCLLDANNNYYGSDNNSGAGTNARLISRNLPVGTYYIEVSSQSAGYTGGPYTLSLQAGLPPGTPISLGQTVSGTVSSADAKAICNSSSPGDRWAFSLTSATTITVDAMSTVFDTYVCLLDANNNFLGSDSNSGAGTNSRLIYKNLPVGNYYIEVSSQSSGYTGGPYTLSLQAGLPPGTPISVGQSLAGNLSSANAKGTCNAASPAQRWTLAMVSGANVTIDASSSAFLPSVCLLDANNNYLGSANAGSGTDATLVYNNLPAGSYFIEVTSISTGNTGGSYALSIQ